MQVTQVRSALLQEEGYYPFGLEMKALSTQAATVTTNNYKFNGGTELENSFDVSYYETYLRNYDAQVGRFTGVDAMAESTVGFSPYQFANNNPISFNDPTGATAYNLDAKKRGGILIDGEDIFGRDNWGSDWYTTMYGGGGGGGHKDNGSGANSAASMINSIVNACQNGILDIFDENGNSIRWNYMEFFKWIYNIYYNIC